MTPSGATRRPQVLAYVSSGVALTGVQAILRALPSSGGLCLFFVALSRGWAVVCPTERQ